MHTRIQMSPGTRQDLVIDGRRYVVKHRGEYLSVDTSEGAHVGTVRLGSDFTWLYSMGGTKQTGDGFETAEESVAGMAHVFNDLARL